MKRTGTLVILFVILTFLLTACIGYRVKEGLLRDTLFSVEKTGNGAYRIFMTHDDVSGYCTYDSALGEKALNLLKTHKGEVLIQFKFIDETNPEWSLWNGSDCKTTSGGDIYMWLMESIEPVSARNGPD